VIDLDRLIDLMSCGPARIFNLPGGTLRTGTPGDVTLLDLDAEVTFAPAVPIESLELGVHRPEGAPRAATTIVGALSATTSRGEAEDEAMNELKPKRVVIVDDSPAYCDLWSNFMIERYATTAHVETYAHPYDALPKIDDSIDLLIVDLEMPGMDGKKFVDYARAKASPPNASS